MNAESAVWASQPDSHRPHRSSDDCRRCRRCFMSSAGHIDDISMRFDPQAGVTHLNVPASSRRRRGRLEQESLVSNFGPVLDLSGSGAKVISRRVPKGEVSLRLVGLGVAIEINARAVWSRRISLFKYEVGFEFQGLTPELAKQLTTLATDNRLRRVG